MKLRRRCAACGRPYQIITKFRDKLPEVCGQCAAVGATPLKPIAEVVLEFATAQPHLETRMFVKDANDRILDAKQYMLRLMKGER